MDNDYAGVSLGGRIVAVDEVTRTLTLDRPVTPPETGEVTLTVLDGTGLPVTRRVTGWPAPDQVVLDELPQGVAVFGVWGLHLPALRRRLFRCLTMKDNGNGTYAVTALQHDPQKAARVDNGAVFDNGDRAATLYGVTPPTLRHLSATVLNGEGEYGAAFTWTLPRVIKGVQFDLQLTREVATQAGTVWRAVQQVNTTETTYRMMGLPQGRYTLTVRAVTTEGQQGAPVSVIFVIAPPPVPVEVVVTPGYFQITLSPRQAAYQTDTQFEFWAAPQRLDDVRQAETTARYLGTGTAWVHSGAELRPGQDHYFYVRAVNRIGKSAFMEVAGRSQDDAAGYLDFFRGKIDDSLLSQAVRERINTAVLPAQLAEIKRTLNETHTGFVQTVTRSLKNQSATIERVDKVSRGLGETLSAMAFTRIQTLKDGRMYVSAIGQGISETGGKLQSEILLQGDRIALVNAQSGDTTPLLVAQGRQVYISEALIQSIRAARIVSEGNPPVFSLTEAGELTARKATISGQITATSGQLDNVTINENCEIRGRLSAGQIVGDIAKSYVLQGNSVFIPAQPVVMQLLVMLAREADIRGRYDGRLHFNNRAQSPSSKAILSSYDRSYTTGGHNNEQTEIRSTYLYALTYTLPVNTPVTVKWVGEKDRYKGAPTVLMWMSKA